MGEVPSSDVNHALNKRGLKFVHAESERANLQELHTWRSGRLRENIFGRLRQLTGMRSGINWAIYDVPPKGWEHYEPSEDTTRQILIIADATDGTSIPDIRIITNEDFEIGAHDQVLTEDFTLTRECDAQFFVDAAGRGYDEPYDNESTSSTFWITEDGSLVVRNYKDFTEDINLGAEDKDGNTMHPFGLDDYLLDQLDALAAGHALLTEIANAEPLYWGFQIDIE